MRHNNVQVVKMLMVETGTYNDQVLRPYVSNLDMDGLNSINYNTNCGTNLSVNALAGVAGNILRPTAQAVGNAIIANGFGEQRLSFMMEIMYEQMGSMIKQILTGYTNYVGVSMHGTVDPNMVLTFNTSLTLHTVQTIGARGRFNTTSIRDASHIITDTNVNLGHQQRMSQGKAVSMRPEDVFSRMGASHMLSQYGSGVSDLRTDFTLGAKKSRRSNVSAPTFLSRTLTAHQHATNNVDNMYDDANAIVDSATGSVKEQDFAQDSFLQSYCSDQQFRESGSITWQELLYTNPHLDEVTQVIKRGTAHQMPRRGETEGWHGSNVETVIATILTHSVPAMMLDLMLTEVAFTATNATLDSDYNICIEGVQTFSDGIDPTAYVEKLIYRLRNETLRDISNNNQMAFGISMHVNIVGDTFIQISVNGGPTIDYVAPSFCDALMAPVLSNNTDSLGDLANDFTTLMTNFDTGTGV